MILQDVKITVTAKFCKHADEKAIEANWEKRSQADSLLFEEYLIDKNIVQRPLNWRHDFIYNDMKIDVKEVNYEYFNIHRPRFPLPNNQSKLDQYRESIVTKQLTHFLFYTSDYNPEFILKPGDVVHVKPFALCKARQIVKAVSPSNYDDDYEGFVGIDTIKILGEHDE